MYIYYIIHKSLFEQDLYDRQLSTEVMVNNDMGHLLD